MPSARPDRLLAVLLLAPFLLLAAAALGLLVYIKQAERPPEPLVAGPFHLQAWLLPKAYRGIHPVAYIGEASAAVATSADGAGGGYYSHYDTLLRLAPDGSGGLKIAERRRYRAAEAAQQWLDGGEILTIPFAGGYSSTTQQTPLALLRPLSHYDGGGAPTGQFDLGFSGDGTWWYSLLDAERIAVIEDPLTYRQLPLYNYRPGDMLDGSGIIPQPLGMDSASGTARLRIGKRNATAQEVQLVDDAVALGDAWEGGMTLALLARPDKLYVLDRATERLVEKPELRKLAEAAINSTPGMLCFYYSGNAIITVDSVRSRLRLHSSSGEMHEIVRDSNSFNYYGYGSRSPRDLLSRLLPGVLTGIGGNDYMQRERRLRRAGRRAPLTEFAGQTGNIILPCGPDRFVLVDDVYQRLVVIEHSAWDKGVRSAQAGGGETSQMAMTLRLLPDPPSF